MRWPVPTLVSVLIAAAAHATTLVPADIGELTRDAQAIVRGRVAAVDSRWAEGRRSIETIVTLQVQDYLKGTYGPTAQFRVPGGEIGKYRSVFLGAPQFAVDQQVVVFLAARGPELPHLVGFSQGVYRIGWSADRKTELVQPSPFLPAAAATPVVRGDRARVPMALAEFERRVRALAGGGR